MNYTALEDRLFEEWKTRSRQCGDGCAAAAAT